MNNILDFNKYKYYVQLSQLLSLYKYKEIVFFCVGNYKVWYDCFSSQFCKQIKQTNIKCFIYGGQDFSIIPENLPEYIDFVKQKHPNACLIVVDNILTFEPIDCEELIINNRSTNIAGLTNNLTFGNISILLKTFPYQNSMRFLQKQQEIINNLIHAFESLIKNGKIE